MIATRHANAKQVTVCEIDFRAAFADGPLDRLHTPKEARVIGQVVAWNQAVGDRYLVADLDGRIVCLSDIKPVTGDSPVDAMGIVSDLQEFWSPTEGEIRSAMKKPGKEIKWRGNGTLQFTRAK